MLARRKKSMALGAVMAMTLSVGSTVFASPSIYYSEEGIGIQVQRPTGVETRLTRSSIEGDKVSVEGGILWATWKDGRLFRANYDHRTKTHRCSVTNDHGTVRRSEWTPERRRAISPWLGQTVSNNKAWAATK